MRDILTDDRLVRRIEWTGGILLTVMILGAWAFYSFREAMGVLTGGAIAISSFQVLKWQLRKAFLGRGSLPTKGGLFASYYLRFLATLFLVFIVLRYGWANPIALLMGLSVVVLSIAIVGGLEFFVMLARKGE